MTIHAAEKAQMQEFSDTKGMPPHILVKIKLPIPVLQSLQMTLKYLFSPLKLISRPRIIIIICKFSGWKSSKMLESLLGLFHLGYVISHFKAQIY